MKISDHQPTLFGHEGYWSKIASADVHIVMADVRYRKEDKLTRCTLADGPSFAAILTSEDGGTDITSQVLIQAKQFRRSFEQLLMNRKMPYRDRLEPLLYLFEDGRSYMALWQQFAQVVMASCQVQTRLLTSTHAPQAATVFGRNVERIESMINIEPTDIYVCGPAVETYKQGSEPCPMTVVIHRMPSPSPTSLLERIVQEPTPTIFRPVLKAASS